MADEAYHSAPIEGDDDDDKNEIAKVEENAKVGSTGGF